MTVFRFEYESLLWFAFASILLLVVFMLGIWMRKKALQKYGDYESIKALMPDFSKSRLWVKFIILIVAFIALVVSVARPQYASKIIREEQINGVEIMIALDVSNSMMAEDIKPNRLKKSLLAIEKLTSQFKNDKVGLTVFAGAPFVISPLTSDYGAVKMYLPTISPGMVSKQGTSLGKAIRHATASFSTDQDVGKAIIIITDGENHEDDAIEAAKEANERGIVVHTIGVGSPSGVPIPLYPGANKFRKDKRGQVVLTKLNEGLLREIAREGKGTYVKASSYGLGLDMIYKEISKLDKKEMEIEKYEEYAEYYKYFSLFALILLVVELFILEKRNKFLKNVKLFKID